MPTVNITTPITFSFSTDVGSVSTVGRSPFHQLIYVDDMQNVFFNLNTFAENVLYYHSSLGEWVTYPALFDDPHTSFSIGTDVSATDIRPQIMLNESTLRHRPLKGDRCKVRNINYLVDDSQKDGVGVTTIYFRLN